jgi:hypothetical protein
MTQISAQLSMQRTQAEASPQQARPFDQGGQQDSWLKQMELAEMASMNASAAVNLGNEAPLQFGAAPVATAPVNAPMAIHTALPVHATVQAPATSPESGHAAKRLPAAAAAGANGTLPGVAQGITPPVTGFALPRHATVGKPGERPQQALSASGTDAHPALRAAQSDKAAKTDDAGDVAQGAWSQGVVDYAKPGGSRPDEISVQSMPGAAASVQASVHDALDPRMVDTLPATASRSGTLRALTPPNGLLDSDEAEEPAAEPTDFEAATSDKAEVPDKLMHLHTDGERVDVWIRDPGLVQNAVQPVLYRLISDLAESGHRLKSLTVNGRTAYRNAVTNRSAMSLTTDLTGDTRADSLKDRRHGA